MANEAMLNADDSRSREDAEERFLRLVLQNPVNRELLDRLYAIDLPDWHLVAGCLVQAVWNSLCGFPPEHGIVDYDVFYFDEDPSWEAEDAVIRRCAAAFSDLPAEVQVRNQGRVHVWFPRKHGVPCEPLRSVREGIDTFLSRSSCVGVRKGRAGDLDLYAPFGLDEVFAMVVRPNPRRFLPRVYEEKTARWRRTWPALTVAPPVETAGPADRDAGGSPS